MRIFLIVTPWKNTIGNHAGMYYLAKEIKSRSQMDVKLIVQPVIKGYKSHIKTAIKNFFIGLRLRMSVKRNDAVLFMEYLDQSVKQSQIARHLNGHAKVLALAHLVPARYDAEYSDDALASEFKYVDKMLVFGHSLRDYFISRGIDADKVDVTYHYADTKFYFPDNKKRDKNLSVICMGNMQRNYDAIVPVIRSNPDITFHVCMGIVNIEDKFKDFDNVALHGFMSEVELRDLMQRCHISLNIMYDTIGSNVISTSLATGLCVMASNVGSIADYIDHGANGLLFNNINELNEQLDMLKNNPAKLIELGEKAALRARGLDIDKFINDFANYCRSISEGS